MANARLGNVIYIDTTGVISTDRNTRVISILLTSAAVGDELILRETASGGDKISIKNAVAADTKHIELDASPIIFGTGIYCQALTAGAKVMLIVSQSSGE